MIRFENLSKSFWVNGHRKIIFQNVNLTVPEGKSLALLGRNGAGKSTLLEIVSGTMRADTGRIVSEGKISWPIGIAGGFHRELTGAQNVRFLARVYGVDTDSLLKFVADFAELGPHMYAPVRTYSSGMRSRLVFGAAMGIRFDTYLIDEVTAVGDASFKRKSKALFRNRVLSSSAVMVSHNMRELRRFCDAGAILDGGRLTYYDDVNEAIEIHEAMMGGGED